MISFSQLERVSLGGQVDLLFGRSLARLKSDARDLEPLREGIRVVIVRTAGFALSPLAPLP